MGAAPDLDDYLAAMVVLRTVKQGTTVYNVAVEVVAQTQHLQYDVPVLCLLCHAKYPLTTTIAEIATWVDSPRGICKTCDGDIEVTVVT